MSTWNVLCKNRGHYRKNSQRRNNTEKEMNKDWREVKDGMIRRFATQGYIPERRGFGNE